MASHRWNWFDCEEIVIKNGEPEMVRVRYGDFELLDEFTLLHGSIELGTWVIIEIETIDDTNDIVLELGSHSKSSNCSTGSESAMIEAAVKRIREVLQIGGCCNSPLRRKAELKEKIDQAFVDAF